MNIKQSKKICSKCKIVKELKFYYLHNRSQCKECISFYKKAYRVTNRDKLCALSKAYREANRDKLKAHRAANQVKRTASAKVWRAKNIDKVRELHKTWQVKNPGRTKNYHLRRHYGITLDQYDQMIAQQNGLCAICGIQHLALKNGLFVDHNHKTNVIRGLLCRNCNTGIGNFKDSIMSLKQAIKYLKSKK